MIQFYSGIGYAGSTRDPLSKPTDQIVGQLLRSASQRLDGSTERLQARAWSESIEWAKTALNSLNSSNKLDLEFGV